MPEEIQWQTKICPNIKLNSPISNEELYKFGHYDPDLAKLKALSGKKSMSPKTGLHWKFWLKLSKIIQNFSKMGGWLIRDKISMLGM